MAGFLGDGFLGGGKGSGTGQPGKNGSTPTIGANGNWFINGVDTGQSARATLDLSKFKQNEIVTVDTTTGELKPSGTYAHDGELETEPDSVIIGSHELSSSAENLIVKNLATNKLYAPLWQEIAESAKDAFIRGHGSLQRVDRYTGTTRKYINPSFDILMDEDQTSFSVYMNVVNAVPDLTLEVYLGKEKLYRSKWKDVKATVGRVPVKLDLETPADFKKGITYSVKVFSESGDVTLRGGNRGPYWSVMRVLWVDISIATQEWVTAQLATIPAGSPVNLQPLLTRLADLDTKVAGFYAPDKTTFDEKANALIDAKLKTTGGSVQPKVLPRLYALFSNTIPTSLAIQGMVTSTNGEATLTRTDTANSRVCVLVENDSGEADGVTGISVDGGISASWTPRDTVIDGKKYMAFFSAGAYRESSLSIKVNFR